MASTMATLTVRLEAGTRQLIARAVGALADSDVSPEDARRIGERLLAAGGRLYAVRDEVPGAPGAYVMELNPFAELALRDMVSVARSTHSGGLKARRILETLTLAGY